MIKTKVEALLNVLENLIKWFYSKTYLIAYFFNEDFKLLIKITCKYWRVLLSFTAGIKFPIQKHDLTKVLH